MKVIFLDVDGELTYSGYSNKETEDIDIEKVKLLKEICDRTGAKVVISSSWRGNGEHKPLAYYTLVDMLIKNGIEVLGDTPYIKIEALSLLPRVEGREKLIDVVPIEPGIRRAVEVHRWLAEHKVDNFVILDDDNFQWSNYGYETHWVQPSWFNGGLKAEHVEQAIEILNRNI